MNPLQLANMLKRMGIVPLNMIPTLKRKNYYFWLTFSEKV